MAEVADERPESGVAARVFAKLGGAVRVAEILGKPYVTVYKWGRAKARGGGDGYIHPREAQRLIDWSRQNDGPLAPEDFFDPSAALAEADFYAGRPDLAPQWLDGTPSAAGHRAHTAEGALNE